MNKYGFSKIILTIVFVIFSSMSTAENSAVETLSPELRALLSEEMRAIQEGMMAIIPAYSSGNTEEIASIAEQIKNSFVLKQKLTKTQRHELHTKLPANFLEQDKRFHYNAGMLAHVAKEQKFELVGFYFKQMSEACHGCHSQYALHKFPRVIQTKTEEGGSH